LDFQDQKIAAFGSSYMFVRVLIVALVCVS
jgi:hypothetical protein